MQAAPAYVRHVKLASMIIRRYFMWLLRRGYGYDDLMQEALMAIWIAEKKYNPAMGTESTYYSRCIYNAVKNKCGMLVSAKRRGAGFETVSLDEALFEEDGGMSRARLSELTAPMQDPAETAVNRALAEKCLAKLASKPKYARAVRLRYGEEWQMQEIAAEMGVRHQYVNTVIRRALEIMRS